MVRTASRFLWLGNHPALDFLNSEPVAKGVATDLFASAGDVLDWLAEAGLLDAVTVRAARARWADDSAGGRRLLAETRALRAALRAALERVRRGAAVERAALEAVNALLCQRVGFAEVVRHGTAYERRLHLEIGAPAHVVVPIAEAAADLLCLADLTLVKRCENPACVLYFYDVSKNHARRWCSMQLCGNRAKVAAHYRRHAARRRSGGQPTGGV